MSNLRRRGPSYRRAAGGGLLLLALAALVAVGYTAGTATPAYYYYYNPGGEPATLTLFPPAATNPVGTSHTVMATVTQGGTPLESVSVYFTVSGSVTTAGACITTLPDGQCTFTYSGPSLPGADLISAFADTNGNGTQDADEPIAIATKAWVFPTSTPGQVTGGGQIMSGGHRVTFGFNARSTSNGVRGECNV